MVETSTGSTAQVPARDRIALPVLVGLYGLYSLDLLDGEFVVLHMVFLVGLYQIFAD